MIHMPCRRSAGASVIFMHNTSSGSSGTATPKIAGTNSTCASSVDHCDHSDGRSTVRTDHGGPGRRSEPTRLLNDLDCDTRNDDADRAEFHPCPLALQTAAIGSPVCL